MNERRDAASLFAHSLKSPLASIRTASELLWKHLQGTLNEKDAQLLEAILRNSKTLDMRMSELLEYANPHGQVEDHFLLSVSRDQLEKIHSLSAASQPTTAQTTKPKPEVQTVPSEIAIVGLDEIKKAASPPPVSDTGKIVIHADPEIADLIPKFLENRQKDIQMIRDSLRTMDFDKIRVLGHSMKGAGGGYGFRGVTEIGRQLEEAAKVKDQKEIEKVIGDLSAYLERVEVIYD